MYEQEFQEKVQAHLLNIAGQLSERTGVLSDESLDRMSPEFFGALGIDKPDCIYFIETWAVPLRDVYWDYREEFERDHDYNNLNFLHQQVDWFWTCLTQGQFMSFNDYLANYAGSNQLTIPESERWSVDIHATTEGNNWLLLAGLYVVGQFIQDQDLMVIFGPPSPEWNIAEGLEKYRKATSYLYDHLLKYQLDSIKAVAESTGELKWRAIAEKEEKRLKLKKLHRVADFLRVSEMLAPNAPTRGDFMMALDNESDSQSQIWRSIKFYLHKGRVGDVYLTLDGLVDSTIKFDPENTQPHALYQRLSAAHRIVWTSDQFLSLIESGLGKPLTPEEREILTRYGIEIAH